MTIIKIISKQKENSLRFICSTSKEWENKNVRNQQLINLGFFFIKKNEEKRNTSF